jgi:hypothetical protein
MLSATFYGFAAKFLASVLEGFSWIFGDKVFTKDFFIS